MKAVIGALFLRNYLTAISAHFCSSSQAGGQDGVRATYPNILRRLKTKSGYLSRHQSRGLMKLTKIASSVPQSNTFPATLGFPTPV